MGELESPERSNGVIAVLGGALGSALTIVGILVLAWNWFGAYFCLFGSCSTPDAGHYVIYWIVAPLMAALLVLGIRSAWNGRAYRELVWHVFVGFAAVAAMLFFMVPTIRIENGEQPPQTKEFKNGEQCYTGGTGFCQGG